MNPKQKNAESLQGAEIVIELQVCIDRTNRERVNLIQARARLDKTAIKKIKRKIKNIEAQFFKLRKKFGIY